MNSIDDGCVGIFETERIMLKRQELYSAYLIDDHFKRETKHEQYEDHALLATKHVFRTWFLERMLVDDYTFKHPKNLWNLLLYFTFSWWTWFRDNKIEFTEHKITLKECYFNLAMPDKQQVLIVQRFKNDRELMQ